MCEGIRDTVRRSVALVAAASVLLTCGCGGRGWSTVAWFPVRPHVEARGEPAPVVKHLAPASGVYKVKFATQPNAADEDDFHTYGGARRVVRRGEVLGFSTDNDGRLYAIAGDETFPLRPRRGGHRAPAYLVWAYRPEVRPVFDLGESIVDAGRLAFAGLLVIGVVALWLWAHSVDRDDRRCSER